jgi:hypothetical protein
MRVVSKRALALRVTAWLVFCAALVGGCAAPAVHPALDQAGAAVERARSAPRVRALAAAELDLAETALENARAAAGAGAPPDQVEHLAYIVIQRAALAEARAAERVARAELGKLQRALGQALAHGPRQRNQRISASREQHQQIRAPLKEDQQTDASVQEDRPAPPLLEGASVQEDRPAPPLLEQDQRERASVQEYRQARAPLEQNRREDASVQEDSQARAPLERERRNGVAVQEDRQARPPLEQDQRERAWVQEGRQARASLERGRRQGASVQEDQQAHTAEQHPVAAIIETVAQDITLSLAQLPFDGAEPTSDALEQLAALAERLVREPGSGVLIEADFNLPDPEARTAMERRVEIVRAVLMHRGIAPARLVVRATGDGPAEPPAAPSFVEPAD